VHGEALAEELGIPGDLDARARAGQLGDATGDPGCGAHGHGGLADDEGSRAQVGGEAIDDRVDELHVCCLRTGLLRGADADEVNVTVGPGLRQGRAETKVA